MNPFTYSRADDVATAVARRRLGRRGQVHRRRHEPARPDEGGRRAARAADRHQPPRPARDPAERRRRARDRGAGDEHRRRLRRAGRAGATRCCPGRSWRGPRPSSATWRRPAATSCSGPAAPTSTTPPRRATSASPGSGCPAIDGFNRNHAILGHSEHCIATHPSDMCVALAALEAVVRVTGPGGERSIPIAEFHRLPGDTPAARHEPGAGRAHHRRRPARRGVRRAPRLPEGPRPHLLRLRPGLGRRRAADRRRQDRGGPHRPRRGGPQALARPGGRGDPPGRGADEGQLRGRRPRPSCATPGDSGTTRSRSSWPGGRSSAPLTEAAEGGHVHDAPPTSASRSAASTAAPR